MEMLSAYSAIISAYGLLGIMLLVQILVADVAGIRSGHVPGTPVTGGHDEFLFRAVRAHANTNESIAAFLVLSVFAAWSRADPGWVNTMVWAYLAFRLAHMAAYYADQRIARSVAFGLSTASLVGLFVVGAVAAWG